MMTHSQTAAIHVINGQETPLKVSTQLQVSDISSHYYHFWIALNATCREAFFLDVKCWPSDRTRSEGVEKTLQVQLSF